MDVVISGDGFEGQCKIQEAMQAVKEQSHVQGGKMINRLAMLLLVTWNRGYVYIVFYFLCSFKIFDMYGEMIVPSCNENDNDCFVLSSWLII